MATKSQHADAYKGLPQFLAVIRREADLTQRQLGDRLGKPQSWIFNCETGNRRVDVTEFIAWATACQIEPRVAFERLLKTVTARR